MATIAVSGTSGFVGGALCRALREEGHAVRRLVRPGSASAEAGDIAYTPAERLDPAALAGCDAVVHLGSAGVADARWSEARKAVLRDSRLDSTRTLATALGALGSEAPRFVSASGIGIYGDRGDAWLTEQAAPGTGFLAELSVEWEAAAARVGDCGVPVALARFGMVLGAGGGALSRMLPFFRLGLGGPIGGGAQWVSWVAMEDAVGALMHLALRRDLVGPFNVCAPQPVTNAELTRALGRVLRRPVFWPLPAFAMRLAFGELADEALLASQRGRPERLLEAGYAFREADLDACLASCV